MSTLAFQDAFNWTPLPHELKRAILDQLSLKDVWSCAQSSRDTYSLCLPILFKTVNLPNLESLYSFLEAVPPHHCQLIRDLRISTQSRFRDHDHSDAFTRPTSPCSDASAPLINLLKGCTSLEALEIKVCGGLAGSSLLPLFQESRMERVKKLRIENLEMEETAPISERLIVSMAFSLPSLESLSLARITRSALHAPELLFSNIPLAQDNEAGSTLPPHPFLGTELRLPQLLRMPKLKQLQIRDTHLGDPLWEEVCSECPLEVLDLGSCAYVSPAANEAFTARILARAPPSITTCALSASLPPLAATTPGTLNAAVSPMSPICKPSPFSPASSSPSSPLSPNTPFNVAMPLGFAVQTNIPALPRLRTLHLTPLVPTSAISTTLSQPALAASPVQTLSCSFHPDDAAEGCRELESFLKERERLTRLTQEPGQRQGQGRKRASSKLSECSITPGGISLENGRARSNTLPTSLPTAVSSPSLAPITVTSPTATTSAIYPSLSTLSIDIPNSPASPGATLSPRRLAAARRRAAERREAALRLRQVAKDMGMNVVLNGAELESIEEGSSGVTRSAVTGTGLEGAARTRNNSA